MWNPGSVADRQPAPVNIWSCDCICAITSINATYHHATAILHDTFFSIRKFISTCGVKLFVAVNSILYGFVIMKFSVCFLEKVKIDMLYSFLYFH
jgi:hypothetical protein